MEFIYDNLPKIVNSLGLICDIVGVALIWHFGLPADINRTGSQRLILEQEDQKEIEAGKRYDFWSFWGFALLCFGFFLQLVSNFL